MQAPYLLILAVAALAAAQHEKSPNLGGFLAQPMAMVEDELPGVKSLCANYTKLYLQELQKFTLWAVQSKFFCPFFNIIHFFFKYQFYLNSFILLFLAYDSTDISLFFQFLP